MTRQTKNKAISGIFLEYRVKPRKIRDIVQKGFRFVLASVVGVVMFLVVCLAILLGLGIYMIFLIIAFMASVIWVIVTPK